LSSLDETYSEYSTAHSDDLVKFLEVKVKVTEQQAVAKASTSTLGSRSQFHIFGVQPGLAGPPEENLWGISPTWR